MPLNMTTPRGDRQVNQKMKTGISRHVLFAAFAFSLTLQASAIDADLGRFCIAKQQQIRDFAETITNKVPPIIWSFFNAVRVDDWQTATNLATRINMASHRYVDSKTDAAITPALATVIWPPFSESYGAYEEFHNWNMRWLHKFGQEIIKSIPAGSIYFGGTDPGRFIISVLSESQVEGKPFFTLTQNQLADAVYLDYLRVMYGKKIHIPTTNDLQKTFQDYLADAQERSKQHQLKPGEEVREVNGRIQVSGTVAVMEVNGLLVKRIFEDNPQREFFVEESYPLEWVYPYLVPHGLIFELQRQPLAQVSAQQLAEDQSYWKALTGEMLGGWLNEKTSLKQVCDFAQKYGLGKNLSDYKGDKAFAENPAARKTFSKLRSSIAAMYAWRMDQAKDTDESNRMYHAADLAFLQAFAICPYSPEALYGYTSLLLKRQRTDDAILVAKTGLRLDPDNKQLQSLMSQLTKR
jgi:hypothetical protein